MAKRNFFFIGFTQNSGDRTFAFEEVCADRSRRRFEVLAATRLAASYGIRIQDLPLLCRNMLERLEETDTRRSLQFAESEMKQIAEANRLRAAASGSSRRPVAPANPGGGWRTAPPR
jgi:hypothetical protein